MLSKKNKAIVLGTLAIASIIAITLICLWPAQKQPPKDPARDGAPGDYMEDNSRFSLINLHWKYTTHAYITSGAISLAPVIFFSTCFIKGRLKKQKAKKRQRLPSFRTAFLPQPSFNEYEMGAVQYQQPTPWPAPSPWVSAPQPAGPPQWAPAPPQGPGAWAPAHRHAHAQGGPGGQAPQHQAWGQQAPQHQVHAVTHAAPQPVEYIPQIGN